MKMALTRTTSALITIAITSFISSNVLAQDTPPQETGWSTSCLSERVCEVKSEITANDIVAARASVFNIRGRFIFQYTIPLGIDLTQGIFIRIDENQSIDTELLECSSAGCSGTLELTSPVIQSMKNGTALQIGFTNSADQDTYIINFSLIGFTDGFAGAISR